MFTGIIETLGKVVALDADNSNLHITVESTLAPQLKIDQSVAHNGVCLTVIDINNNTYKVTAIKETLDKTNLKSLKLGDVVNLERAMKLGDRLDGHLVQGHIDEVGTCSAITEAKGSHYFTFKYAENSANITIEKGSITVNGVSLTVVNAKRNEFTVAIIPFTFNHTTFKNLSVNSLVNLEFDVVGKYVSRLVKPFV
jgi:riboflavin synthase